MVLAVSRLLKVTRNKQQQRSRSKCSQVKGHNAKTSETYETERSEDGEAGDVSEAELDEREGDDDEVEDVPALLEVVLGAHGHQLDHGLDGEGRGEELKGGMNTG